MKKDHVILFSAIVGFIAYSFPYILDFIPEFDAEFKFFNKFYAIGMCFGFSGVLISIAWELDKFFKFFIMSIGIFFGGLFLTFLFDSISDYVFKTKYYVLFNIIISVICFFLLVFRKRSTRY